MSYEAVREILFVSHGKQSGSPDQTLDRLFHKNLNMAGAPREWRPSVFNHENMAVRLEVMSVKEVLDLRTRPHIAYQKGKASKKVRHFPDNPLIVCILKGTAYLIDGNRRIRYLAELGRTEVKVYVCRMI